MIISGKKMVSELTDNLLKKFMKDYDLKDKRVLNMGVGEKDYSEFGFNFINIDNLDWTKEYPVKNFLQCDASNTPFEDDSFDAVLVLDILEHCEDPLAVLKEAYRVLKKGHKICVSAPFMFQTHGDEGKIKYNDYWRFTAEGIMLICRRVGFKIIDCGYVHVMAQTKLYGNVMSSYPIAVRVNLIGEK